MRFYKNNYTALKIKVHLNNIIQTFLNLFKRVIRLSLATVLICVLVCDYACACVYVCVCGGEGFIWNNAKLTMATEEQWNEHINRRGCENSYSGFIYLKAGTGNLSTWGY